MRKSRLEPALLLLTRYQLERPWLVVALIVLTLIPAGLLAKRLELRTSFSELLPDDKPSVIELRRTSSRLAGASTLTVVAEGSNVESLKRFVDALSPRLRMLGPNWVAGVDDGTRQVQQFFEQHKHLYADLRDLEQARDDLKQRWETEVAKRAGFDLGLDDEDETESEDGAPSAENATVAQGAGTASGPNVDDLVQRFNRKVDEARKKQPGIDGYYIGEKGKLAAILVRTPLGSGSPQAFELRRKIEAIVAEVNPRSWDPALKVGFTGNLITSAEQHKAVTDDLTNVGISGVALILGVVLLYFLRLRTLVALGLTIAVGCIWAFAFARLSVGYLNTATGFLVSIIAGNGINFSIIYMARFIEARRDEQLPLAESIRISHVETHTATLAAAGAAGIAYGSLAITDFRGFKHFGLIGGAGMMLCWLATYLVLPAVLVIIERVRPMFKNEAGFRARLKGVYGYPFAWVAQRFPRFLTIASLACGVVATYFSAKYFIQDPMEYDLANVRNERTDPTSAGRLSVRVDKIVGRLGQDGRAILTERLDQVRPLVDELNRRRAAAPKDEKPFEKVVSIYDLLPTDQERKLEVVAELKSLLERARKRGIISDADWTKLAPHIPERLAGLGIPDLPEQIARPFTEKNGDRGKIVYIVPSDGESVYDARYLMRWADSFREVKLPNGEVIRGTGDPVIFSDMLINVKEDAPKAIALSLTGTLLVILFAFRGRASGVLALFALVLGLSWLVAFLSIRDIKLNFLNFVALPISIGVGADYAINIMKRREQEGDANLYRVIVHTGGAVILCSLTTTLGYVALLLSINRAVKSFGLAAAVGEVTTLFAGVAFLPAFLFWLRKRRGAPESTRVPASASGGLPPSH